MIFCSFNHYSRRNSHHSLLWKWCHSGTLFAYFTIWWLCYKYDTSLYIFHRNGSVINDLTLSFDGTSVPHHTQMAKVLIQASSTVSGFDIEGSSISVEGIGMKTNYPGWFSTIFLSDELMISSYFQLQAESGRTSVSSLHSLWYCCHGYCQITNRVWY